MSRYTGPLDCKVYVGGLTRQASREEVERVFAHYGKLRNVFVARNPPGFAFIEFENPDDAEDSVRALDGRMLCGVRVRVEISHGKSRHKGSMRPRDDRDEFVGRRRRSRTPDNKRRYSNSRSNSRSRSRARDNGRIEHRERDLTHRDENGARAPKERGERESKRRLNRSRSRS